MQMQNPVGNVPGQFPRRGGSKTTRVGDDVFDGNDQLPLPFSVVETEDVGRTGCGVILRIELCHRAIIHQHDAEIVVGRSAGEFQGMFRQRLEQTGVNSEQPLAVAKIDVHAAGGLPLPLAAASCRRRSRSSLNFEYAEMIFWTSS